MENWRTYQIYSDVLDDRTYITEFLGIELPLNESGHVIYTNELRSKIISEHLLVKEGVRELYQKTVDYLLDKTAPLRGLAYAAKRVMEEEQQGGGHMLGAAESTLKKYLINPLIHKIMQLLNKYKLSDIWEWIDTNVIQPVYELSGVQRLFNLTALSVFLKLGWQSLGKVMDKFKDMAMGTVGTIDQIKQAVTGWAKSVYEGPWDTIKSYISNITNIDITGFISLLSDVFAPIKIIAASVTTVANILEPATKGFLVGAGKAKFSEEDAAGRAACKKSKRSPECVAYKERVALAKRDDDKGYRQSS